MKNCYKPIRLRAELVEKLDQLIEDNKAYFNLFNGNQRSDAIAHILTRLLIKNGRVTDSVQDAIDEIDWNTC